MIIVQIFSEDVFWLLLPWKCLYIKPKSFFIVGLITVSKIDYRANFQQIRFLATFTMNVFLVKWSLWDIHFFSNYRKGWRHFIINWWDLDVFSGILVSPKPLVLWGRKVPHFIQKTQVMRVIVVKYGIFKSGSCLKYLFLI